MSEGSSKEEVVEGFCVGAVECAVKDASSSVLNRACEMDESCFKVTRTELHQTKHFSLVRH